MQENKEKKQQETKSSLSGSEKQSPLKIIKTKVSELASKHPTATNIVILLILISFVAGIFYFQDMQSKIYIEKAVIEAPIITLAPQTPSPIEKLFVSEGDYVSKGERLAIAGGKEINASTEGIITYVNNAPGHISSAADPIIKMIDPQEMRVVGRIQEDKGLNQIIVGQKVIFTVDAFSDKQYTGIVSSIGATARSGDIVFNISDKRQENEFDVKVQFDSDNYPELKTGMSAKMWVYK